MRMAGLAMGWSWGLRRMGGGEFVIMLEIVITSRKRKSYFSSTERICILSSKERYCFYPYRGRSLGGLICGKKGYQGRRVSETQRASQSSS